MRLKGAAFVDFDVVHEGLDVIAVGCGGFFFALGEALGHVIAEAAITHVGVEPGEFIVGAGDAVFTGPGEGVFIGRSWENLGLEVFISDAEELAGPEVHAEAEVSVEVRVEGSGTHEADFIAEAGEVNDSADFITGGAGKSGGFRHGLNESGRDDSRQCKSDFSERDLQLRSTRIWVSSINAFNHSYFHLIFWGSPC